MKTTKYIYYIIAFLIIISSTQISCSNDDKDIAILDIAPGKAILVLPINNTECEYGEIIANKAAVIFDWEESSSTEKYELEITNLVTREITRRTYLTTNTAIREVKLERGYPYSWIITSVNSGDITTASDVSKFYLVGEAGSNNIPFPATLLSPISGSKVTPVDGKITLKWQSSNLDTDGDNLTFTLFVDTVDGNQEPLEEWKGMTQKSLDINVEANNIYYWHVETSDGINTAVSSTYTFRTGEDASSVQGTIVSTSQEILDAISAAVPGEMIYVHGGNYTFDSTISIDNNGTSNNVISLLAYPNDSSRPKFNFSSMSENSSNRGVQLNADNWYIQGIDVFGAGDNGMNIEGSNNLIEFCTFSENKDTGLQIGNGASNNTILNCDSFFNADSSLENADGFACKLDAGTGNKFIGCRAWQNLDDGWDGYLRGSDNITTTYENCWSIKNGYLKDGSVGAGDGNGFKTGGSDNKDLKHNAIYTNCIAVGNTHDGFDHNSNRGEVTIYNCSTYDNGNNYSFSNTNPLEKLTIKNSNVLGDFGSINATALDITNNSWQNGIAVDVNDFKSIDYSQLLNVRKADGNLPDVTFFHLKAGSDLIDKGVDIGLSFNGSAPDLGAFEF